jgi:uncharacterized repeat protein (TIGR01451 family)
MLKMRESKVLNGKLRRSRALIAAGVAVVMSMGQSAGAFLETGTLLTNSASATYKAGDVGTSVSYSATAKILVANPKIFLWKDGNPTYVATTGGYVTFTLCFSNGGANSAFDIIITDKLPTDVFWVSPGCNPQEDQEDDGDDYGAYQVDGPAPILDYSQAIGGPWTLDACPPVDWGPGVGEMGYFLRWTVDKLDIKESGCIWYTVRVRG